MTLPRPPVLAGTLGGVVMMLLGLLLFSANDALGKFLLGTYAVGQLMLVRSVAGLCAMAVFIRRTGPEPFLQAQRPGLQLLRAILSTGEASLFFWAVSTLPLAEVITYYMAGPIYVTALSPLLLGERVGWQRWTAVVVGFAGVVLALHPSPGSLSAGAVCALAGSLSYALFLVATRKLAGTPNTVLMTFQLLAALAFGGALVAMSGWVRPSPLDLTLMLALGMGSLGGNLCVNQSLRMAPATVVVPYQYTLILWGMLFGYLFFDEVIGPLTLTGAGVIVGSGLFIFWRERRLAGRTTIAPATAKRLDVD